MKLSGHSIQRRLKGDGFSDMHPVANLNFGLHEAQLFWTDILVAENCGEFSPYAWLRDVRHQADKIVDDWS